MNAPTTATTKTRSGCRSFRGGVALGGAFSQRCFYRQAHNKRYTMRWSWAEDMGLSGPMPQGHDPQRPFF